MMSYYAIKRTCFKTHGKYHSPLLMLFTRAKRVTREELGKIIAKKERCRRLPKRMSLPLLT